jgi:hypothetical protein
MKNENAERKHSVAGYVSIALAFLMIAVAAPAYVSAAESGNYTYTVIDNGAHVEITRYHGPGGIVDIPSMIEGKPVTSLGSYCFSFMYGVTEVTIPDSVINITSSFYCCYDLRSVHLGDNVQNILSSAFISCPKLQSIDIPASVTSISASAFYRDVALQSINVDPANPYYVSQSGALFNKPMTSLM